MGFWSRVWDLEFGVWGFRFRVWDSGFSAFLVYSMASFWIAASFRYALCAPSRLILASCQFHGVRGLGFRGLGFRAQGLGFGVWGLGFGVWGIGFRVWGLRFGV